MGAANEFIRSKNPQKRLKIPSKTPKTMENAKKIHILTEFKPYFRLIEAFNHENFNNSDWHDIILSVFYAFCAISTIILVPTVALLLFWRCAENDFDFIIFVVTIPLLISSLQVDSIFIALMWKSHIVHETIECVQKLVDRRKLGFIGLMCVCGSFESKIELFSDSNLRQMLKIHIIIGFFSLLMEYDTELPVNQLRILIGCLDSAISRHIFKGTEKKHAMFTNIINRMFCGTTIVAYAIPLVYPISYMITDYPPMKSWRLPIEGQ